MMEDDDDQGLLRDEGEEDSNDPFYTVRAELRAKLSAIEARTAKFEELLDGSDTATNAEFKTLRKELARETRAADAQLKDLRLTVRPRARTNHIYIRTRARDDLSGMKLSPLLSLSLRSTTSSATARRSATSTTASSGGAARSSPRRSAASTA